MFPYTGGEASNSASVPSLQYRANHGQGPCMYQSKRAFNMLETSRVAQITCTDVDLDCQVVALCTYAYM